MDVVDGGLLGPPTLALGRISPVVGLLGANGGFVRAVDRALSPWLVPPLHGGSEVMGSTDMASLSKSSRE